MENVQQGTKNFSLYKLPRDWHDYGISTTIQNFKMVFKKRLSTNGLMIECISLQKKATLSAFCR